MGFCINDVFKQVFVRKDCLHIDLLSKIDAHLLAKTPFFSDQIHFRCVEPEKKLSEIVNSG